MVSNELYKRYRPKTLSEVIGQDSAVSVLRSKLDSNSLPHCLLFTGPSGVGKTTLARILARKLMLADNEESEINCAICEPLDTIRRIEDSSVKTNLLFPVYCWVLDEFQSFSRATHAQQACLKMFEDVKPWTYFFLCTTDPAKIIPTIRNRCTEIRLSAVPNNLIAGLLRKVAQREKKKLADVLANYIADAANGSVRQALVLLEQVIDIDDPAEQEALIQKESAAAVGIDLCRALMDSRVGWSEVAQILRGLDGEEPEKIRRAVLGYARAVLLKGHKPNPRAMKIIRYFANHFFDSGHAGLAESSALVIGG